MKENYEGYGVLILLFFQLLYVIALVVYTSITDIRSCPPERALTFNCPLSIPKKECP